MTPPPPLSAPWDLKPISSATAGGGDAPRWPQAVLGEAQRAQGRDTPILVWWFSHPEGDVDIEGRLLNRYRVWHPAITSRRGMIDENCLIIPGSHRLAFLSRVPVPWKFPEAKGQAWLKHRVEEMGTLENFLPEVHARETKVIRSRAADQGM